MKKLTKNFANAETKNALYLEGYRFLVEGDYKIAEGLDPSSGMPNVDYNLYAFTNKEEAEAFAKKQNWVFNENVHAKVKEIPNHTETTEEMFARLEREKEERKAKKEAREKAKAEEKGMTLEEYKAFKKREKEIKTLESKIVETKAELEKMEKRMEELKK